MKSDPQALFNNLQNGSNHSNATVKNLAHHNTMQPISSNRNQHLKPLPTYSQLALSNSLLTNQAFNDQQLKYKRTQTPPNNLNYQLANVDSQQQLKAPPSYQSYAPINQQMFGSHMPIANNLSFASQSNMSNLNMNNSINHDSADTLQPQPYSLMNTYEPNKRHLDYLKYDNNWIIGANMEKEKRLSSTTPPTASNLVTSNEPNPYLNAMNPNNSLYYSPMSTPIRNNLNLHSLLDPQNKRITQPYQQQLLNQVLSPQQQNQQHYHQQIQQQQPQYYQKPMPNNFQTRSKSLDADKFLNLDNGLLFNRSLF